MSIFLIHINITSLLTMKCEIQGLLWTPLTCIHLKLHSNRFYENRYSPILDDKQENKLILWKTHKLYKSVHYIYMHDNIELCSLSHNLIVEKYLFCCIF